MSSLGKLQVGIIGAGVAGLAAAIELRRAGHDVELFERSRFKNEVGAAMVVSPNAVAILDRWGFDSQKFGGVEILQMRETYGSMEPKYGHKAWSFHRVDLHKGMKELVTDPDQARGTSVKIRLATEIIDVNCKRGVLTTIQGEAIRKDLIVVADGAHGRFVEEVTESASPNTKLGRSFFRCLVPFDRVTADSETHSLFKNEDAGYFITVDPNSNVFCINYPCRDETVLNVAVLHDTRPDQQDAEDWNSPATLEDLLECTKNYHPTIRKICAMTDEVKVFTLMHRAPLQRYARGKAVLVGDAPHNMLPTHAQGAAMSLEDAAALEVLFAGVQDAALVEDRLHMFDHVRVPRAVMTQLVSSAEHGRHSEVEEEVRKFYSGPFPTAKAYPWSEQWRKLFFGHDIFEETKKVLTSANGECSNRDARSTKYFDLRIMEIFRRSPFLVFGND